MKLLTYRFTTDKCPVEHDEAMEHELIKQPVGQHADYLCRFCGMELRINNNADPTPYSEAP